MQGEVPGGGQRPTLFQRSLPAKSMKLTLLRMTTAPDPARPGGPACTAASPFTPWLLAAAGPVPSPCPGNCSSMSCRMACERELCTFISVCRTCTQRRGGGA